MNLSERSKGYKKMAEFINELDITSCDDPDHLKIYKNIKCALTFVSSDRFGYLCDDEQIEIADNHWPESLIDGDSNVIHLGNVADILLNANHEMHPGYDSKFGVSYYGDRWLDIHRVFTNPLPLFTDPLPPDDVDSKRASNEFIRFEGAVIIYKTMNSVAKSILEKASRKKIRVDLQVSAVYNLGAYKSIEEAKEKYEEEYKHYEIGVDLVLNRENLVSSEHEFVERITDEYMTREEIEADWKEDDEVDVHAEFEDNIKLGIFKANVSEKMYEKILEMNNYKFIKNDNGGELVCQKIL